MMYCTDYWCFKKKKKRNMDKSAWERLCENKRIERRIIRNIFFFRFFSKSQKRFIWVFVSCIPSSLEKKSFARKPSFAFASNLLAVSAILNHLEKDKGRGKKIMKGWSHELKINVTVPCNYHFNWRALQLRATKKIDAMNWWSITNLLYDNTLALALFFSFKTRTRGTPSFPCHHSIAL